MNLPDLSFSREPAVYIAGFTAITQSGLLLLIAFGLPVTPDQKLALGAFSTVVTTFLAGVFIRSQVTPVAGLPQLLPKT